MAKLVSGYSYLKVSNFVVNSISANGSNGSSGQFLTSNGTATYWSSGGTGTVTSIATGNGLTGGPITTTGTISVLANNGITANSTGLFVTQGTGTVVNSTGVHVNSAYIGTLSANNTTYVNGKTEGNLNVNSAATLATARNIGDVSFNGSAAIVPERIYFKDTRSTNYNPFSYIGATLHLKSNGTDSLNDGGSYHGVLDLVHWSDSSGGVNHQLGLTDNGNMYIRYSTGASSWSSWNIFQLNSTLNANIASYLPTYTGVVNGSSHTVGSSFIANATGVYHTGTMNAASHTVGTSFTANSTLTNTVSLVVSTNTATIGTGTYFVSNGNVGIGTSTPPNLLHVGSANTATNSYFSIGDSNVQRLRMGWNLAGTPEANVIASQIMTDQYGSLLISSRTNYPSYIALYTNDTANVASERIRIAANGNVGIGNNTPVTKLYVEGTIRAATVRSSYYGDNGGTTRLDVSSADCFFSNGSGGEVVRFASNGNVGIGTSTPVYKLEVSGSFAATTKSFVIDHPSKRGMKLRHGSLEGPENGVYVRGRTNTNIIELPDYWVKLIDKDSITVSLTAIGKTVCPSVGKITNKKINLIGDNIDCFFHVFAERKDVEKLVVEY